jgi:tRNA(Ile)-lysidine synthase
MVGQDASPPLTTREFAALMAPLGPFSPAPRLAAGVSGGPHSLCLAILARDWVRARGGSLLALVADHGLRPESGAEAASVAERLRGSLGIPVRILPLGLPPGPALQERARAARLQALLAAAAEAGAPWLLLGHHRADQAETLAFRALRGSGPRGLAGMAPARAAPEALLLRPLLEVPPGRIEAVLAAAGIEPVRDPSNADPRFARARLRAALDDPAGEGEGTAALAAAAAAFSARAARQGAALAARLAEAAELRPEGFCRLDPAALGRDALARAALSALVRAVAGAAHPPPVEGVATLLARGHGTLHGARLMPGRGGRWLLAREAAACAPPVAACPGALWDGRFRLEGEGDPAAEIGVLGPPGAALRALRPELPAALLTALPVIRRDGVLVAVPSLLYPDEAACARFRLSFAPLGGPVAGDGAGQRVAAAGNAVACNAVACAEAGLQPFKGTAWPPI